MDSDDKMMAIIAIGVTFILVFGSLSLIGMSQKYYKDKDIRHLEQELKIKQIEIYGEEVGDTTGEEAQ